MSDVDLRLLRYFVAVAEERNFTRAAGRLMMTQPALSRAVRALEATVGVPLLVRRYRDVEPTQAGRVLLEQARQIDERASAAIRLVRRAEAGPPRLRVSAPACEVSLLDELVSSYNRTGPEVPASAVVAEPKEQADELRDGSADASLIRPPFDERGLDSEEIFAEPWLVALPERHPLAARSELTLAQLAGLPVIRWRERRADGYLMWPFDAASPDRWIPGPAVCDSSEIPALVRLGQGIAIFPRSLARNASAAGECGPAHGARRRLPADHGAHRLGRRKHLSGGRRAGAARGTRHVGSTRGPSSSPSKLISPAKDQGTRDRPNRRTHGGT